MRRKQGIWMYEYIGFLGMLFIDLCYIPQIWKAYKTKSVKDISILFWLCLIIGLLLYLIYSILINKIVYLISNLTGLLFNIIMLILLYKCFINIGENNEENNK